MTARVLVGVYPGEVGYEKAAFDDAGVPGAPCRLLSLPPALLDETLGFVGKLSYLIQLLKKTSKAMAALGEERASVWRQVDTAVVYGSGDFMLSEKSLAMLQRCGPTLRSLGVVEDYRGEYVPRYQHTVPLNAFLVQTPALRRLSVVRMSAETSCFPALPIGDGALPALEYLELRHVNLDLSEEAKWQGTCQKLRTLMITTVDLSPDMIKALRPPLGRLQHLRVAGHKEDGTSGYLNDALGALLGRQGDGAQEKFEGHPTLEIIDTCRDYESCDVLCRAIRVGALPRLHSLRTVHDNFEVQSMVQSLLLASPSPPPLKELRCCALGKQRLTLSLASGLLRSLSLEHFQAGELWPFIPLSELGKEEEESSDDRKLTGSAEQLLGGAQMIQRFTDNLLACRTLRSLHLGFNSFSILVNEGRKIVTGSPSSEGIVKIIDFGQLEELHIARLWDPTVSTYDGVVPYGTPTDLKDVTTFFKSIVQAPCLTHLTITDPQIAAIPLRFEARQLRNVCLTALAVEDLVIDDGRAQLGSVHETSWDPSCIVIVTHSLCSLLVQGASPKLKNLQLSSSTLRDLHINRFYGWQSDVSFLETAMIDAPWLQRLAIEKAPALRQLSLNSHVLSSLSVIGANVLGGFYKNWRPASFGKHTFGDSEDESKVPGFWEDYRKIDGREDSKLPSALTFLDVCCPSLRSFSLTQCPGVQSLSIEQRETPAPLAAADDKVFETAMASVLEEIEVSNCDGLSQLVLKAAPASNAIVPSPKASSPQKKLKTTTATAMARPPRRSAIAGWKVEECGRLQTVEVDDGWVLGPKTKRSLTYFVLQHPDVKVRAKGIGDDKMTKK